MVVGILEQSSFILKGRTWTPKHRQEATSAEPCVLKKNKILVPSVIGRGMEQLAGLLENTQFQVYKSILFLCFGEVEALVEKQNEKVQQNSPLGPEVSKRV